MILGITGGVGCGKSTVSGELEKKYDFIMYYTDDIAKELMTPGHACYDRLVDAFGSIILEADGRINRKAYAELIYGYDVYMQLNNKIVHPAVWEYIQNKIERRTAYAKGQELNFGIETALPDETFVNMCDHIWFVYVDTEIRIQRLMATRDYSREYTLSVMARQPSDEEYRAMADVVVDNNGTLDDLLDRVKELMS